MFRYIIRNFFVVLPVITLNWVRFLYYLFLILRHIDHLALLHIIHVQYFIISYFISKKKCNLASNIYRFDIDRSSSTIICPSLFIIKILNEIKYPWVEEQQAGIILFYSETNFLTTNNPLPVPFLFNFLCHFFFLLSCTTFIRLSHFSPWSHWIFTRVSAPFYFSPFPATMREVASRGWEKIVCNLWQVPCASRFCNMNASRWHRFKTVSSKSNFPFQFVITSAYIRRCGINNFVKWWNIRLLRKK